jgi:hypothetical protein
VTPSSNTRDRPRRIYILTSSKPKDCSRKIYILDTDTSPQVLQPRGYTLKFSHNQSIIFENPLSIINYLFRIIIRGRSSVTDCDLLRTNVAIKRLLDTCASIQGAFTRWNQTIRTSSSHNHHAKGVCVKRLPANIPLPKDHLWRLQP